MSEKTQILLFYGLWLGSTYAAWRWILWAMKRDAERDASTQREAEKQKEPTK